MARMYSAESGLGQCTRLSADKFPGLIDYNDDVEPSLLLTHMTCVDNKDNNTTDRGGNKNQDTKQGKGGGRSRSKERSRAGAGAQREQRQGQEAQQEQSDRGSAGSSKSRSRAG